MKKITKLAFSLVLFAGILAFRAPAQSDHRALEFNFGFEKADASQVLPLGWYPFGGNGYVAGIDSEEKKSGRNSIRIEAPSTRQQNSFGAVAFTIPGSFEGKEIELRGFLKFKDVSNGFVGLWCRIEGDGGVLQFDNMAGRGLQGSADWDEYSIKLPLPEDATSIVVGVLLTGEGRVWADDLSLLVDGKDISVAKRRMPVMSKAAQDKEFDNGSGIGPIRLNRSRIQDLVILGKIWGFLKYYHPAIASGDHNWDYELFRILPKVLAARNAKERNNVLSAVVDGLGTFDAGSYQLPVEKVKLRPDLGWINDRSLGTGLAKRLDRVRDAKRQEKNYYIGIAPGVGNPVFKHEEAYAAMKFPDAGFRLLCLYRYWNVIQYYYPYKYLVGEDWNDVLSEFVPRFVNASTELEYKKAVLELIGRLNDTHANIWGADDTLSKLRGLNAAPVGVAFVENKAVVNRFWDQGLAEQSGLKIGDVIKSINDRSVDDIVKEQLPLTPASNYPTKLRDIALRLLQTNEDHLDIEYEREGHTAKLRVRSFPPGRIKRDLTVLFAKPIPPFSLVRPDIGYLYPGSLKRGEINEILPQIERTKAVIVDLRCYPSDFIVFSLGDYLVPAPSSFVKFSNGSVSTPGLFSFTDELEVGKGSEEHYAGKVVILINEVTLSQAEYTAMALRRAPRAIVVGGTTAGADGNVSPFYLPGGISTQITGIGVYYPDGSETQRVGIIPDIVVKPTVKGVREGRDEVLEKAIDIIEEQK